MNAWSALWLTVCIGVQPDHIKKGYCPRLPGVRMPATYINHYAANGGVVVPQFGGVTPAHFVFCKVLLQGLQCWSMIQK